jgi:hypothetical protein
MAKSITQRQNILLDQNFFEGTGSGRFSESFNSTIESFLSTLGNKFTDEWVKTINDKKIVASGNIESKLNFEIDDSDKNRLELNIFFPYYAKFVDRGVRGVAKLPNGQQNPFVNKNAAGSPYQFKNYGMNAEGRASLKKWMNSSKAKVTTRDVKKYGAVGTESKFKKISEEDSKLNTLIYNIKKYGIKKRDFIDPVLNNTLKGAAKELSDILGKEIIINIFQ